MVRGQGKHLTPLAMLLGATTDHQQVLYTLAQERYREFIRLGETSPSTLIKSLDITILGHPIVAEVKAPP